KVRSAARAGVAVASADRPAMASPIVLVMWFLLGGCGGSVRTGRGRCTLGLAPGRTPFAAGAQEKIEAGAGQRGLPGGVEMVVMGGLRRDVAGVRPVGEIDEDEQPVGELGAQGALEVRIGLAGIGEESGGAQFPHRQREADGVA